MNATGATAPRAEQRRKIDVARADTCAVGGARETCASNNAARIKAACGGAYVFSGANKKCASGGGAGIEVARSGACVVGGAARTCMGNEKCRICTAVRQCARCGWCSPDPKQALEAVLRRPQICHRGCFWERRHASSRLEETDNRPRRRFSNMAERCKPSEGIVVLRQLTIWARLNSMARQGKCAR